MAVRYILSDYVEGALDQATYDKLDDGTFAGRVPSCPGSVAFGATLRECEAELQATLEDWIVLGLKLGHHLPVVAGIDLNEEPTVAALDAVKASGLRECAPAPWIRGAVFRHAAPVHGPWRASARNSHES